MKNIWMGIALIALAISTVQAFTPQKGQSALLSDRLEDVKKTGVLRCGYIDYPPYIHKDAQTGRLSGMTVDMMAMVEKMSGLKVEWNYETTWATAMTDVNLGRFDALCGNIWPNSKRAREALMLEPYAHSKVSLFRNAHSKQTPENGVYMAIDGTYEAQMLSNRGVNLKTMPFQVSYEELMQSVAQGKADYMLLEDYKAAAFNAHNPDMPLVRVDNYPTVYLPMVMIVGLGQRALADYLNSAQAELRYTGAMDEIWKAYNPDPDHPLFLLDAPK